MPTALFAVAGGNPGGTMAWLPTDPIIENSKYPGRICDRVIVA